MFVSLIWRPFAACLAAWLLGELQRDAASRRSLRNEIITSGCCYLGAARVLFLQPNHAKRNDSRLSLTHSPLARLGPCLLIARS